MTTQLQLINIIIIIIFFYISYELCFLTTLPTYIELVTTLIPDTPQLADCLTANHIQRKRLLSDIPANGMYENEDADKRFQTVCPRKVDVSTKLNVTTPIYSPFSEIHKENVEKGRRLGIFMTFGGGGGRGGWGGR